ncbi:hypothetical protein CWATWH0003_1958t4, partial [Crocosphaera watsonii WH 0003]
LGGIKLSFHQVRWELGGVCGRGFVIMPNRSDVLTRIKKRSVKYMKMIIIIP